MYCIHSVPEYFCLSYISGIDDDSEWEPLSVQDCWEGFKVKNVRVCVSSYFYKIIGDFLLENLSERQSIRISWALFCLPLKGSICNLDW